MIHAVDIARIYNRAIEDMWRGDPSSLRCLNQWLRVFRIESCPDEFGKVIALSPHAAGGRGVRWSESSTVIYGKIPGQTSCYRIPVEGYLPGPLDVEQPERARLTSFVLHLDVAPPQPAPHCTSQPWGGQCECAAAQARW
jgi:hypothetical protein